MEWCECNRTRYGVPKVGPPWTCETCGKIIPCDFCSDDASDDSEKANAVKAAIHHHVDYVTCEEHLSIAIDNVSCR
jgi:hypothetical protein